LDTTGNTNVQLSGAEKAAALFLVLGKDNAARLASFFSKEDIKKVVDAAGNLRNLNPKILEQIVSEFGENFAANGMLSGSETLSQFFEGKGDDNPAVEKPNKTGNVDISALDPDVVRLFFENEPPQISALLLQRLDDEMAVKIISDLESNLRNEIFHAYLNGSEMDPVLQSEIEDDLIEMLCETKIDEGNVEGIEKTANLINQFSEETSDEVVRFFEGIDQQTAVNIRKSLFKFSSIVLMSKPHRAILMDSIEADDIVKALSDCDEEMCESVLEVLSQRNRRMVEAEMARSNVAPEETGKSQKKFISNALRLAREGAIALPDTA